jgi:hypothetical protein
MVSLTVESTRPGNARFSPTNDTFRFVVNETANCTLEQYIWAIPPGFDTSNPEYQIALFDATVDRGAFGNPLAGWIVWSPLFYVRELMSDTTTTTTTTTSSSSASETAIATAATTSTSSTALLTGTATGKPAPTPTPTATSSSPPESGNGSPDASDVQIGVGVGVGVGGFLLVLLFGWFLLRRRKRTRQNQPGRTSPPPMSTAHAELDANEIVQAPGETKGRNVYEMPG